MLNELCISQAGIMKINLSTATVEARENREKSMN